MRTASTASEPLLFKLIRPGREVHHDLNSFKLVDDYIVDHKAIFSLMMFSFYIAPCLTDFLSIPYSRFKYADVWLWGLLLFGLLSYLIGAALCGRFSVLSWASKNKGKLRAFTLCSLLLLSLLYLVRLGLPYVQSFIGSLLHVALWAFLLRGGLNFRVSLLLYASSLVTMVLNFILMGGIPLFRSDILSFAKLSPVREIALPLFMLGAVFLFLNVRDRGGVIYYGLRLAVFAAGATVFSLNGDMHDLLAIVIGCILAVLYARSSRDRVLVIGSLALTGLLLSYLMPSVLGLFRQSFNLQVLRHILIFVEDPILGSTKGAVSLGLRRDFLGANLIYGEGEDWTLTSTWLGPAYLDLGLVGVFLTMFFLGAALELMFRALKTSGDEKNQAALYITSLAIIVSLFEDGASLPFMMFMAIAVHATFSQLLVYEPTQPGHGNGAPVGWPLVLILVMSVMGLSLTAYAYCSEFGGLKTLTHVQAINLKRTQANLTLEQNRFYHAKLVGPGTICVKGNITVVGDIGGAQRTLKQNAFEGCLWAAKKDQVDLGWFSSGEQGSGYAIILELSSPPSRSAEFYLRVETPSLSPWVTNDNLIQAAICIEALALAFLISNLRH